MLNDIITLCMCFSKFVYIRAHFSSALIGRNLTAQLTGSHRRIGGRIHINFQRHSCKLFFLFLPCGQSTPKTLPAGYLTSCIKNRY